GRAAAAFRRLRTSEPVAHTATADDEHARGTRDRTRAPRMCCAHNRATRDHTRRNSSRQPRGGPGGPAFIPLRAARQRRPRRRARRGLAALRLEGNHPRRPPRTRPRDRDAGPPRAAASLKTERMFAFIQDMQLTLDALDRLVDTLEERGPLSAAEAARALFATSSISTGLACSLLIEATAG